MATPYQTLSLLFRLDGSPPSHISSLPSFKRKEEEKRRKKKKKKKNRPEPGIEPGTSRSHAWVNPWRDC